MSMPGVLPMSMPATHPSPLPEERERAETVNGKFDVTVANPVSLSFVSEADNNQARSHYQNTDECFSLSRGERVGVRGKGAPAVLAAFACELGARTDTWF